MAAAEPRHSHPFRILWWMQWRKTRVTLSAIPPAAIAACLLIRVAARLGLHPDYEEILGYGVLLLAVAVAELTVLLIHSDADDLRLFLPLRMLRLPVAPWKLAAALMSYGFLAVGLTCALSSGIVRVMLPLDFAWWLPPLLAVLALAALHAWSFALRNPGPVAAAAWFVVFLVPVLWLFQRDETFVLIRDWNPLVMATVAPLALYGLGVAALRANRRGGLSTRFARRAARGLPARRKMRPRFGSPTRALSWYEWRRFGWQLPLSVYAVLIVYFLAMPLLVGLFGGTGVNQDWSGDEPPTSIYVDWLTSTQFTTTGLTIAAIVAGAVVGALMVVKAGYWNARSHYLHALPITTRDLARPRLVMAFESALIGTVLLAVVMGAVRLAMAMAGENVFFADFLQQGYRSTPPWAVLVFFFGVLFITMWVAMWAVDLGIALVVYAVVVGLPAGVVALLRLTDLVPLDAAAADLVIEIAWWSSAGVMFSLLAYALIATVVKGLVHAPTLAFLVVFAALYVTAFWLFAGAYEQVEGENVLGERFPHPINWPMWLGLAVLPVAPFLVHPLFVERARHR